MRSGNRYRRLYSGIPYDPAAVALFAAMTTQPTQVRKALIDRTIRSIKAAGVWAKLDVLYVFAAHSAQPARVNWVAPGTYDGVATSSPTFTTDRGYQGDGASSFVESNFNPATAGGKFVQGSAHLGVWSRTGTSEDREDIGNSTSFIRSRSLTLEVSARVNQSSTTFNAGVVPDALGHTVMTRASSAGTETFRNGVSLKTTTVASVAPASETIKVLRGAFNWSTKQIAAAHIGSNLSSAEVAALYAALQTYMTGVGA